MRAIVAGERNPLKLAELSDPRIHASKEEIAKSLEGNWRQDLLFVLHQEVKMYDVYQQRIAECDQQLEKHLAHFADTVPPQATEETKKKRGKQYKNNPQFHLADELQRITGADLTRIDGIDVMVAQTLASEAGLDMNRWKTEAHFASWLGLCPDNRISGDKVLNRGTRHVVNRAATSLRMAATTLLRSQTYLGAQYRRLRTKLGAPKAITAMAHRLARLVYRPAGVAPLWRDDAQWGRPNLHWDIVVGAVDFDGIELSRIVRKKVARFHARRVERPRPSVRGERARA